MRPPLFSQIPEFPEIAPLILLGFRGGQVVGRYFRDRPVHLAAAKPLVDSWIFFAWFSLLRIRVTHTGFGLQRSFPCWTVGRGVRPRGCA